MSRVLIVDDDCDGSEVVATFLRRCGHAVDCVPNGHKAMAALLSSKPAAVVLDLRMPQMDGIMLLQVMRSYLRWAEMPVILLSAHVTDDQSRQAQEMGVRHIFHKTKFSLDDLGAAVNELTGTSAKAPKGTEFLPFQNEFRAIIDGMVLSIPITAETETKLRAKAAVAGVDVQTFAARTLERVASRPALDDSLAPLRAEFDATGMTEEELVELLEIAKHEVRAERRARQAS